MCFDQFILPWLLFEFLPQPLTNVPSQIHVLILKKKTLNTLNPARMHMNVGPCTRTWRSYQEAHILEENWLSLSKQPSIANISSARVETLWLPFVPCYCFVFLDHEKVLGMLSQPLWVYVWNCPVLALKPLFLVVIQHLWFIKSPCPFFTVTLELEKKDWYKGPIWG